MTSTKIAIETGYQARFAAVPSYVLGDDCINPGERGVFGIAVLTRVEDHGIGRPRVRGSGHQTWSNATGCV